VSTTVFFVNARLVPLLALVALAVGGAVGFGLGSRDAAQPVAATSPDASAIYAQARDAVVTVRTDAVRLDNGDLRGLGTAFHIGDGYYVTSAHVVEKANKVFLDASDRPLPRIEVPRDDGLTFEASVVGSDKSTDVALLKAKPASTKLEWAQSVPAIGSSVYAIGNPRGDSARSLSSGVISGLNRFVNGGDRQLAGLLQTDAAMNPGNSGGPLLDAFGRVVGLNAAILSNTGNFAGIAYSVPSARVRAVIEAMRDGRKLEHPSLGVTGEPNEPAKLSAILPDSAAERAGLKPGDLVLTVAGQEIMTFSELTAVIEAQALDSSFKLIVKRGGKLQTLEVQLKAP
jgi:2-alkenal reductase